MYRKIMFLAITILCLGSYSVSAQGIFDKDTTTTMSKKLKDRLVFGGNIGFQFGSATFIEVSPIIGYRITPRWQAGVGPSFMYIGYKYRDPYGGVIKENYSLYGGRLYTQYNITRGIFAHGESEFLNVPYTASRYDPTERRWIVNPMIGGGLRTYLGRRSSFNIMVLYNLNYQRSNAIFNHYNSPFVVRGGISL